MSDAFWRFPGQPLAIHHGKAAVCVLLWIGTLLWLTLFWRLARSAGTAGRMCFGMATFRLVFHYVGILEPLDVILIGAFRYFFTGQATVRALTRSMRREPSLARLEREQTRIPM